MELPIYNDNLKSSGSWSDRLKVAAQNGLPAAARLRELQLKHQSGAGEAARFSQASALITTWARTPEEKLSQERLLDLHRALTGTGELRQTEPRPLNAAHDPAPAILLPRLLDNAFDWFTTEGFAEMHAVEQATVVFLRLLDLHPFVEENETTALLAASFYTERAGLPPLILFSDDTTRARYRQALDVAFRMLTQPLVEFFAEMLTRAIEAAGPPTEQ